MVTIIKDTEVNKVELSDLTLGGIPLENHHIIIGEDGNIKLPKEFIEKYQLEKGDTIKLEVTKNGEIHVIPMFQVPVSQRYFWTKEWQEGEREADEDIKLGRVKKFDEGDDPIAWLDSDEAKEWAND